MCVYSRARTLRILSCMCFCVRCILWCILVCMRIRIHAHAYEHGLTDEQIISAYRSGVHAIRIRKRDLNSAPQRWATIGFESSGRAVELVFVYADWGETVLIFHANYATKGFIRELAERN